MADDYSTYPYPCPTWQSISLSPQTYKVVDNGTTTTVYDNPALSFSRTKQNTTLFFRTGGLSNSIPYLDQGFDNQGNNPNIDTGLWAGGNVNGGVVKIPSIYLNAPVGVKITKLDVYRYELINSGVSQDIPKRWVVTGIALSPDWKTQTGTKTVYLPWVTGIQDQDAPQGSYWGAGAPPPNFTVYTVAGLWWAYPPSITVQEAQTNVIVPPTWHTYIDTFWGVQIAQDRVYFPPVNGSDARYALPSQWSKFVFQWAEWGDCWSDVLSSSYGFNPIGADNSKPFSQAWHSYQKARSSSYMWDSDCCCCDDLVNGRYADKIQGMIQRVQDAVGPY